MTHVLHQLKRGRTYGLYVFSQKMCNDINDVYKKYIYIVVTKRKLTYIRLY